MEYHIYIIYSDESIYEGKINTQQDFDTIPKDKTYQFIRIFYDNSEYSHLLYGMDFIYLGYKKFRKILVKAQWDEIDTKTQLVELKGPKKETVKQTNVSKLDKTFIGKLLDDNKFNELRLKGLRWRPPWYR